ncbi:MAG: iron ABC transporter permease [Sulfolobales archaeon]|nr:iron ABC transporter permease [Sulfolobales archaeon]MDW8082614.1 iron ABC transporter permease [Sulfolobales archaeon]
MAHQIARATRLRFFTLSILLTFMLLTLIAVSVSIGASMIPIDKVFLCLLRVECDESARLIVELRVARTLAALLTGGMLAVSGVLVQGISRNPLADPFILGVSSTALAALSAFLLLDPTLIAYRQLSILIAFAGALLGYFLTTSISLLAGGTGFSLILSGIAVSALFSGVSHVLLFLVQDKLRHPYVFLLMGSTSRVLPQDLVYLAISLVLSVAIVFAFNIPKALNAYLFGESYLAQLGYRVRIVATVSAFVASLLAGSSVAVVGIVGFIGLAAPHITRIILRTSDHRATIVLSLLTGSSLAILSDIVARLVSIASARGEIPLGVVTSVIGAPFLAYLVIKGGKK